MMEDQTALYFPNVNSSNIMYYGAEDKRRSLISMVLLCVLPFEIIVGVLANIWALTVVIRRRLWLQHEGYVYLGSILITNALILILHYVCIWLWCLDESYSITRKTDFLCKVWSFFFDGFCCTGWLVLALLINVCLRSRRKKKEDEAQAPNSRPSRCALIVSLTLIILTLLVNTWKLVSLELDQHYVVGIIGTNEYYCQPAGDWRSSVLEWIEFAALFIHGIPMVFVLPVMFALIACSGCRCTGCKYGADSGEHFPRVTFLSVAGIVFLQFPTSCLQLFVRPKLLLNTFTYYEGVSEIFCATIIINGLVFAVVPILCIVTMPRFREATFKSDCRSCGWSQKLEIESIAMREAGQEN